MTRAGWSFLGVMTTLALCAVAPPAAAKRTGMNLPCHNCHEGRDIPQVTAMLSATRVEPGQSVTLTVTATHQRAKVGGVLVDSKGLGSFEMVDAVGTQLFMGMPSQATHAMPHPYMNGQVQFSFRWVAPMAVGAAEIDIWSNAANDNMKPEDDSAGETRMGVSVGCDGKWFYVDKDKDGAGEQHGGVFSCMPMPDRIEQGGDCNDQNPQINPAAVELCNSIDDNCDGKADDGFTPVLLVTDADGDGFGSTNGMSMIGCPPVPNFATTFDDCNDTDASIHPGAAEAANGRDDNCNGKVDDAGVTPGTGGGGGSGGTTAPLPTAPADPGCAFAPSARLHTLPGFGAALMLGWAFARRTARRRGARLV